MSDEKTIVIENKAAIETLRSRIFKWFFGDELGQMRRKEKVDLAQPELHQILTERENRTKEQKND